MSFVGADASPNLFIIADIEQFGYNADFLQVWVEVEAGKHRAVLLRFHYAFILYAPGAHDHAAVEAIIRDSPQFKALSGLAGTIGPYEENFEFAEIRRQHLAELRSCSCSLQGGAAIKPDRAARADAEGILGLRRTIKEFRAFPSRSAKELGQYTDEGIYRYYVLRTNGQIVSSAGTIAESSSSAMIGGVMTHRDKRRRGFATACVAALCRDLCQTGKTACLFYDNPLAGRIYKKLGFVDIGRWTMCIRPTEDGS